MRVGFYLENFFNEDVLNIFSDCSTTGKDVDTYVCYGAICVRGDVIIDHSYYPRAYSSNNEGELLGLKMALDYAFKYKDRFKVINIFSDSLYSVDSIRYYIQKWRYDESINNYINGSGNNPANSSIIVEIYEMYNRLLMEYPNIRIFHQKGHIDYESSKDINVALRRFKSLNHTYLPVHEDFIKYISFFNAYIDNATRQVLHLANMKNRCYTTPINIIPHKI